MGMHGGTFSLKIHNFDTVVVTHKRTLARVKVKVPDSQVSTKIKDFLTTLSARALFPNAFVRTRAFSEG